jgi:signal transduction histidine kinase/ActR/RegA family two-component response regulator
VLAAFSPVLLLAVLVGMRSLRQEQSAIEQEALEEVRELSAVVSRELLAQIELAKTISLWRELDDPLDLQAYREMAQRLVQQRPGWLTIRLTDPAGKILLDVPSPPAGEPVQVVDMATHRRAVETKEPVVGRVIRGARGRAAFAIRAPVVRDGEVRRVVTAVVKPDSINELLAASDVPKDWVATVIDGDGYVAARTSGPPSLVATLASERAREAREGGNEGLYEGFILEGVSTISAFHRLPLAGWSVHIGIPRDVVLAPVNRYRALLAVALIGSAILMGSFLWLLTREIRLRRDEEASIEGIKRLEALGRMTGGVAHDFNNLLTIIQGSAELIKRRLKDPERIRALADSILAGTQRAEAVTRQLLAFARRDTHEPADFRLQDRSIDLEGMLRRAVREDVTVSCSIPAETWAVRADPNVLEVALLNLAVNASDAMPNGGKLTVTAKNATLDEKENRSQPRLRGEYVAIAVSDTGTGIAPEDLPHVFEPFFTTKPTGKGTGLGLSQVYGFAQQSGGTVTVESRLGRGTTFTLYLPRSETAAASDVSIQSEAEPGSERQILLVEDNPEVAEVTSAILSEAGYEVSRAVDAASALTLLSKGQRFDVVLSDIVMEGGMSGIDLARRIRQQQSALPIVLMTGYSQALSETPAGEFPVLLKPFQATDLTQAIEAALNSAARA